MFGLRNAAHGRRLDWATCWDCFYSRAFQCLSSVAGSKLSYHLLSSSTIRHLWLGNSAVGCSSWTREQRSSTTWGLQPHQHNLLSAGAYCKGLDALIMPCCVTLHNKDQSTMSWVYPREENYMRSQLWGHTGRVSPTCCHKVPRRQSLDRYFNL